MSSWLNVRKGRKVDTSRVDASLLVDGEAPVCMSRAWHDGNLLPGYVRLSEHVGYFVHEGQVVAKEDFQLFLDGKLEWLQLDEDDPTPAGALQVGRTSSHQPLFIAKVEVDGEELFGKVQEGVCFVAARDGRVVQTKAFMILAVID